MDEIYHQLTKGVRKSKHKTALFLCGAAGSGKTTTRSMFLKDAGMKTTFVTLNIDDIRPIVGSQDAARTVFGELVKKTMQDGYSFLYDGTCRDKSNIVSRIKDLDKNGYKVVLGIVYAPLDTVLKRVRQRVSQPLEEKLVKDIYEHLKKNVETYMTMDEIDELYLYNNETTSKLVFHKSKKRVQCILPDTEFYFDVSKYC